MSAVVKARDLGAHLGWLVRIPAPEPVRYREVVADKLRGPWVYEGVERIAIIDKTPRPPFAGAEYAINAETDVEVLRPIRKRRTSTHKGLKMRHYQDTEAQLRMHDAGFDLDSVNYGLDGPFMPWESDSTALVHILWDMKHRGKTLENDADYIASRIMHSRWFEANKAKAKAAD